jgi:hypothetical protein
MLIWLVKLRKLGHLIYAGGITEIEMNYCQKQNFTSIIIMSKFAIKYYVRTILHSNLVMMNMYLPIRKSII